MSKLKIKTFQNQSMKQSATLSSNSALCSCKGALLKATKSFHSLCMPSGSWSKHLQAIFLASTKCVAVCIILAVNMCMSTQYPNLGLESSNQLESMFIDIQKSIKRVRAYLWMFGYPNVYKKGQGLSSGYVSPFMQAVAPSRMPVKDAMHIHTWFLKNVTWCICMHQSTRASDSSIHVFFFCGLKGLHSSKLLLSTTSNSVDYKQRQHCKLPKPFD